MFSLRSTSAFLFTSLLIVVVIFSTGCPLEVKYPLVDPEQTTFDEGLVGTWETSDEDALIIKATVTKRDDHGYDVEVLEKSEDYSSDSDEYTGYTVKFEKEQFLWCQPKNVEGGGYYYFVYELTGKKEMTLYEVNENLEGTQSISSSSAMRVFVEDNVKKSSFKANETTYTKK